MDKIERSGKIKIRGFDPEYPGLVIVEIPLNEEPSAEWADCFRHPTTFTPGIHPPQVEGKAIVWRAYKDRVDKDIKWVFSYIDQANACYEQVLKEQKEERARREQEAKKKEAELEQIQKNLENL
jgi:hypothetical protein